MRHLARNGYRLTDVIACRLMHRPPKYLPAIVLFITYRCNLRCKMCGVCELVAPVDNSPELSLEECKSVVRSGVKLGTTLLVISGGEALLRPEVLFETIRYARDNGIAVHLCTNGVFVNPETAGRLAKSGVNTVSVSIESPFREIHDALRGEGSFDSAVNAVKLLRELAPSIQVGVSSVITAKNFRGMSGMVAFAESLGAHQVKFAPIHTNLLHRRKQFENYGELIFRTEDLEELDREVRELAKVTANSRLQTSSPMFLSGITRLYRNPPSFPCYAGYALCVISPRGIVAPCSDLDGAQSIREKPLEEIWCSREFQALREKVRHCQSACWDTLNAEMSIRLRPRSIVADLGQTWKDLAFYFKEDDT
jgi:MoaA/NifB/PqqE/SkfB family radical SAM enzyme